ncbi:MAG: HpcH/HpaI aldolase family protein [Dehalococcoidia bacterium]|tara:strand:- start:104 stop:880 length:777 start_codon:yes stop_codon:yes gene_type:complete
MRINNVRNDLLSGKPAIGPFIGLQSANVAELMGNAGFNFVVIESEHNGIDSAEIEHMLMAVGNTDAVPIVRIPSHRQVYIQKALDIGALGIVVPAVKTAEEAAQIVSATKFPPHGKRSWGPLRASKYTFDNEDYLRNANDNILVVLIIETVEAVENLEEIAAVPGIDVLFLGPWDMCLSLGLDPLLLPHPEIDEILEKMIEVATRYEVVAGAGASVPEDVGTRLDQGIQFLSYGPDYALLSSAAFSGVKAFKSWKKYK